MKKKIEIDPTLFKETSHSPALIDIVGEKMVSKVIDFCFIANPYYPTTSMMRALKRKMVSVIKAYPSSNPRLALEVLGSVLHVKPEYLVIGNGATELITIIGKELIDKLAIPVPTFSEYIEKLSSQDAACLYPLSANQHFQLDLDEYGQWISQNKLGSALVINPGNPTGQLMPQKDMLSFLEKMKHLNLILVDESFIDFADEEIPSLIPHVGAFSNLVIIRSMSKHCGVPGLRLGYCCSSNKKILEQIKNRLPIWNINSIAEYFLTQLSLTDEIYHKTRKLVIADVRELYHQLKDISGFEVYPTGSNFILIKIICGPTAFELQMRLLEEFALYIRDCSNKAGLDDYHIRVSSQGKKKDKYLVEALGVLSKEYLNTNRKH